MAEIKTDGNMLPPPTLTVERRRVRGADVAIVVVVPSDSPPVRYRGRIWVRVGPRRSISTAQDERILNEKRRYGEKPYDLHSVQGASLSDLSRALFEEAYLPGAFAPEIFAANAPCRVYWFDDRIEIGNPGGPYGTVICENVGQAGTTDYCNPNLADAMKVLGLVQRFGLGFEIARRELAKGGNPSLEFRLDATHVVVIVRPREKNRP